MNTTCKTFVLLVATLGCVSQSSAWFKNKTCVEKANGASQLSPCWLQKSPSQGLVLSGPKHIGPNGWAKAKQDLINQATLEFAILRQGQEVSTSAYVVKHTSDRNGAVSQAGSSTRVAEFNQSDQTVKVRVKVNDYYHVRATEQIYVWVEEQR